METKWKLISILLVGLFCFGIFFLVKGSMALDTSDATTEQIKKASMSQTPVAKKETKETVDPKDQREIYLAGGCFWGVEEYFSRVPGVIDAVSGYANGKGETTKYELVPQTGHAETVHITYNVKKVSLKELLLHYFRIIAADDCPAADRNPTVCAQYVFEQQRVQRDAGQAGRRILEGGID